MVEFKLEPYKEVTIRTFQRYPDVDTFLRTLSSTVPPGAGARFGPILWSNGILFGFAPFAPGDSVSKEYLDGRLPWDNLDFAPMPNYREEIRVPGKEVVFVIKDVSENSLMGPLGKWVSENLLGMTKQRKTASRRRQR